MGWGGGSGQAGAGALIVLACTLAGCVSPAGPVEPVTTPPGGPLLAVFPVENLSGRSAPLEDLRRGLIARMQARGLRVLDDDRLDQAITRHRVRYTAGVDTGFARALREEAGVDGVVIPSLERYDPTSPPRVALFARLVSTTDLPVVRWIDGTGRAGDDSPGLLGMGLVEDPSVLAAGAVESLVGSLVRHVTEAGGLPRAASAGKFRPKIVYRADTLDPARTYSVAVVPFFNKSDRKYGGEILALHMMRSLAAVPGLSIVEPGVVREELLRFRIIMNDGISLADTDTILGAVGADLVLNGEVLQYREAPGPSGAPAVDFAVLLIERRSRRIVYSSYSENAGDDGVFFFDLGRVNTAHAMAAQMARAVAARMLQPPSPDRHPPASDPGESRGGGRRQEGR